MKIKKLIFLFLIPLFLGGCFDYNELNDLAIVSGVGIDFEGNEYAVTFEILSTKKEGEKSSSASTYNVTAKGKTITEAFANNGKNMDKVPYYDHIEIVVISEEIAKEHLKEVSEYLIRSSKFRNEFYTAIATDTSAKEVISTTSKEKPIAANFIVDLLEHNNDSKSAAYYTPFTETLNAILTDGEDAIMSTITVKEKEIVLSGMGVFKDFELKHIFNPDEASIINLLNNFDPKTVFFEKTCEKEKTIVISAYDAKVKIEPNREKVKISATINARINEDNCGYDLRKEKSYEELEKEFKKIIEEKMNQVLTELQKNKSNALHIGKEYYNSTRDKDIYRWTNQNFEYEINLKINKKGLIFEVNK